MWTTVTLCLSLLTVVTRAQPPAGRYDLLVAGQERLFQVLNGVQGYVSYPDTNSAEPLNLPELVRANEYPFPPLDNLVPNTTNPIHPDACQTPESIELAGECSQTCSFYLWLNCPAINAAVDANFPGYWLKPGYDPNTTYDQMSDAARLQLEQDCANVPAMCTTDCIPLYFCALFDDAGTHQPVKQNYSEPERFVDCSQDVVDILRDAQGVALDMVNWAVYLGQNAPMTHADFGDLKRNRVSKNHGAGDQLNAMFFGLPLAMWLGTGFNATNEQYLVETFQRFQVALSQNKFRFKCCNSDLASSKSWHCARTCPYTFRLASGSYTGAAATEESGFAPAPCNTSNPAGYPDNVCGTDGRQINVNGLDVMSLCPLNLNGSPDPWKAKTFALNASSPAGYQGFGSNNVLSMEWAAKFGVIENFDMAGFSVSQLSATGVLLHELSHFSHVARTNDVTYALNQLTVFMPGANVAQAFAFFFQSLWAARDTITTLLSLSDKKEFPPVDYPYKVYTPPSTTTTTTTTSTTGVSTSTGPSTSPTTSGVASPSTCSGWIMISILSWITLTSI